jgi:hypothetical protein
MRDFWGSKFIDTDFDSSIPELPFIASYHNTCVRVMTAAQDRYIVLHSTNEVPPKSEEGEDSLVIKVHVTLVAALDGLSQNFIDVSFSISLDPYYNPISRPMVFEHPRWIKKRADE